MTLLRAFISHTPDKVRELMMTEREDDEKKRYPKYPYTIMDHLLNLIKPENIHQIKAKQDIEDAILSLFTQLVRDEKEYKMKVGKKFLKIAKDRILEIKRFKFIQTKHQYMVLDDEAKE